MERNYKDINGTLLVEGDKVQIEYCEDGNWRDYNTVKITVLNGNTFVKEYPNSLFSPAPAPITTVYGTTQICPYCTK